MTSQRFLDLVQTTVCEYVNAHTDKTDNVSISPSDVYIVWNCKALQNFKALASTPLPDGMYYELTYNGDKNELYVDAYKKFENYAIRIAE